MIEKEVWKSKLKASTLHICLSLLVASAVGAVVFFVWYPSPFGFAGGGLSLFLLVTCIDLVLGPALTFVVFNREKKRHLLLLDFSVIAVLQISALLYGLNAVYLGRPVAVVYEGNRFRAVRASDISAEELKQGAPQFQQLSMMGPQLIGTREIRPEEQDDALTRALNGEDIGMRPKFWVDLAVSNERIKSSLYPIQNVLKQHPEAEREINALAAKAGVKTEQLGYLPVLSSKAVFTIIFVRETARFVDYYLLDPN